MFRFTTTYNNESSASDRIIHYTRYKDSPNIVTSFIRSLLYHVTEAQKLLFIAQRSQIRILSLSNNERSLSQLQIDNIPRITAFDIDPFGKLMCWSDNQEDEIKCAHRNGSGNS